MTEILPEVSLGGAAIIIFLVCAFYVIVRGIVRMIVGTLVIAASAYLGFRAWQIAPALALDWLGDLYGIAIYGLPIMVFLVSFLFLRLILQTLSRPFARQSDTFREDRFSPRRFIIRLPLIAGSTALFWFIGAVIVHHLGALEEIRTAASSPDEDAELSLIERLKPTIEKAVPAAWLAWLDPLTSPDRLSLAKLIAIQEATPGSQQTYEPVIDPETGKPFPRAIIVDDPELQDLARDGSFGTLLRHPRLNHAMEDPRMQRWLKLMSPSPPLDP